MLNQAFSADNFERIFDIENRKANVDLDYLSENYKDILIQIKKMRTEIKKISQKRKCNRTQEETDNLKELNNSLENSISQKKEIRHKDLENISREVNKSDWKFTLTAKDDLFVMSTNSANFFVIKQLQYNIRKTFGVKQSARHTILSQIKLLLNDSSPKYVIRTDVTKFFESIPQDKLFKKIENNTLLSIQSKKFIRQILEEYNNTKDTCKIELNKGVPRGVGISSYLSELYMKDIDNTVRKMPDVIYYARYVDDIFIVISPNIPKKDINTYFDEIEKIVEKEELSLKLTNDDKCNLLDLTTDKTDNGITYLGYNFDIERDKKKENVTFGLSTNKKENTQSRIKKSIEHFNKTSKYNIQKARKELLLCLRFLCTNTKLSGTKSRVKTGVYYSNDLLDNKNDIPDLNAFLAIECNFISPYKKLFSTNDMEKEYIKSLSKHIRKNMNFSIGFNSKTFRSFSYNEMKTIKRILQ
jgi:hypothetical protein